MNKNEFPAGWGQERVSKLIAHYDNQTEDEAIAEDEDSLASQRSTWMEIPLELVPVVREVLRKRAQAS